MKQRAVELVVLGEQARRALARRHPEVTRHGVVLAVGAREEMRAVVMGAIEELVEAANAGRELHVESMVERLLAPEAASDADGEDARRLAVLRARVVRDYGSFAGRVSRRWKKEARVFAVPFQGDTVYLSFQFDDDGQPVPAVRDVLEVLAGWSAWDVAEWFVLRNPRLERVRPADLLRTDPTSVVAAAHADAKAAGRNDGGGAEIRRHAGEAD